MRLELVRIDEMAVKANANTASGALPVEFLSLSYAGFYCMKEVQWSFDKAEDFTAFLRKIKEANEKRIVVIPGSFRTHHAKNVREETDKLNISLIYLPPYSPDLNPMSGS